MEFKAKLVTLEEELKVVQDRECNSLKQKILESSNDLSEDRMRELSYNDYFEEYQ